MKKGEIPTKRGKMREGNKNICRGGKEFQRVEAFKFLGFGNNRKKGLQVETNAPMLVGIKKSIYIYRTLNADVG